MGGVTGSSPVLPMILFLMGRTRREHLFLNMTNVMFKDAGGYRSPQAEEPSPVLPTLIQVRRKKE